MPKLASLFASVLLSVNSLVPSFPTYAQNQPASSTVPVTTVVTVLGPKYTAPPPVAKEDVIVFSNKTRLNVKGWMPAQGDRAGLQLAILIDNAVDPSALGNQLNDLKQFITAQSKSTAVGIFYAANGTVQTASVFDLNHEAAARKLRLPLGALGGNSPSIYLSLKDLAAKWPPVRARREVLLISSGIDRLNPGVQDPYFDSTLEAVQKAGITIHTIYAGGTRFGSSFRGDVSQGKLLELTRESGGQSFFEGVSTPISFAPYLNQLDTILRNQYLLTIETDRSNKKKGELRPIKITTEERNVVLSAPSRIFVPGP